MKRMLVAAAITTFSMNAFSAQTFSNGPTWDFVEAGYSKADVDDIDIFEPSGINLEGSVSVGENFFVNGAYRNLSDEEMTVELELSQLSLGVGYRYGMTKSTDLFAAVSFENLNAEAKLDGDSFVEGDENGFGVAIGVRSMVIDQLELSAQVKQIELDETSTTGFEAGINYYFTPALAIGATYEDRDEFTFTGAHLRYAF
ncbi:porin family protein [Salinimonas iocasae]|uniref:Porin family protein n=1 Tax=Salinimonas iocasae TaxID=2572577 RepID=A0A5B7YAZ5_9ALTE|nr:porin family protein [Salinimonas iocasae]QCZ92625.1 porin family protein [Salinimonas iocasae]